eukprot:c39381_g1_i1.p1 GENE.c39381_g1_i1~~c39381_g1_i1.p1  ORF type:complete len:209 (+),score=13.09 c39381_g1_i1:63-689(+)
MALRLGDIAPNFDCVTSTGNLNFHQYIEGSWAILFSHPQNYTPVCTTELGHVAKLKDEWAKRGVKVIGLSVDSIERHHGWLCDIEETQGAAVNFPLIADTDRKVSTLYNMLDDRDRDDKKMPLTVRSVFIIDNHKKIRIIITYPASTGRNFDEVLRVVDSLQLTDNYKVATPVNWKQGGDCVIIPSISNDDAKKLFPKGWKEIKPYLP